MMALGKLHKRVAHLTGSRALKDYIDVGLGAAYQKTIPRSDTVKIRIVLPILVIVATCTLFFQCTIWFCKYAICREL